MLLEPSVALAAVKLTLSGNEIEPQVRVDADAKPLSIFQSGKDLWIISTTKEPLEFMGVDRKLALSEKEDLEVSAGQGVRLRFEEAVPKVTFNNASKLAEPLSLMSLKEGLFLPTSKSQMITATSSKLGQVFTVIPSGGITGQNIREKFASTIFWPSHAGYVLTDEKGMVPSAKVLNDMLVLTKESSSPTTLADILEPLPLTEALSSVSNTATAKEALDTVHQAIEKITGVNVPLRYKPKRSSLEKDGVFASADMQENRAHGAGQHTTSTHEDVPAFDQKYPVALQAPAKDYLLEKETEAEDDFDFDMADRKKEKSKALSYEEILIPYYGDDPYDYYTFYKRFTRNFLDAQTHKDRNEERLRLAKLAIAFGRAPEAVNILGNMPKDKETGYPRSMHARLVYGVALVMMGRGKDALDILEKIPADNPMEMDHQLWTAFAYEELGRDKEAIELFRKNLDVSLAYPLELQKELRLSYGRVLLRQERLSVLVSEMKELAELMPNSELPPEGYLLLGRANMLLGQADLAEELLATAAASNEPEVAFMAQYEFVNFLLGRGDINLNQAIGHLEDLRFLWRGGQMEEEILRKLGRIYLDRGDIRLGLERLKYYTAYFYDSPHSEEATEAMTESFEKLFKGEVDVDLDDLAMLGIYYDFRELTPPGKAGDELIRNIGVRLQELGLFDRAIALLERQLKYRSKDTQTKGGLGHDLAVLYYLNRQYEDGLNALVRTESDDLPKDLVKERTLIQAKIKTAQREFDEARKLLLSVDKDEAEELISDIGWGEENYDEVIKFLEETYTGDDSIRFWNKEDEVNFLRLAVAYHQKGDKQALENLKAHYPERMLKEELRTAVDTLLIDLVSDKAMVPEVAENELQSAIKGLDEYNEFVDYYTQYNREREEEKRERQIFNRRMRQVSAPSRRE